MDPQCVLKLYEMNKEEEKSFLIDVYEKSMSLFKMLENIDMSNSDSYKPQDKVVIHDAVQREVGFDEVKKAIYKPLHDWTVRMSRSVIYCYITTSKAHRLCL